MKITNFTKLTQHQISDLYSAEQQLVKALPKMAEAATTPGLKKGFEVHLKQTKEHVERLEKVAKSFEIKIDDVTCKGMKGLIAEGEEAIESIKEGVLLDAALIGAAQKVEHYEISGYGTLISHLEEAGFDEAVTILEKTLAEEEETDENLTTIAAAVNPQAFAERE